MIILSMMFILPTCAFAEENNSLVEIDSFMLQGIDYSASMPVVDSLTQFTYSLEISKMQINNSNIYLEANITQKDSGRPLASFSAEGMLYHSSSIRLTKTNGITAILNSNSTDISIINTTFEKQANADYLFPANYNLDGKSILSLALSINGDLVYFEDEFPVNDQYDKIYEMCRIPSTAKVTELMDFPIQNGMNEDLSE